MEDKQKGWKNVPPPDRVSVDSAFYLQLLSESAMLAALKKAGVEDWDKYKFAMLINENDPVIRDIRLSWKKATEI